MPQAIKGLEVKIRPETFVLELATCDLGPETCDLELVTCNLGL
jgi:hypothetical protein